MSHQLHNSLVRILTADGIPVGVGFLAAENLILTCAHVIAQASGSEDSAHFDLPLLTPGESFSGRVSFQDDEQDIACIEFSDLPHDASSARLVQTDELWGHSFRAFGVPSGHDSGVWASGVLRDRNAQGWLHIEDTKATGITIKPGFSGGPVWDENLGGVIGMIVAAERDESTKVAFCISVEKLSEALPALKAHFVDSQKTSTENEKQVQGRSVMIAGDAIGTTIIIGDGNRVEQKQVNTFVQEKYIAFFNQITPSLPKHFVSRHEYTDKLETLFKEENNVVLSGMPGIGKSVLASAFVQDKLPQEIFKDGSIWIKIGQDVTDLFSALESVARTIGITKKYTNIEHLSLLLVEEMKKRQYLIVLDDIWDNRQIEPFLRIISQSKSRLLITSRRADLANSFGAKNYQIRELSEKSALDLLAKSAEEDVNTLPKEANYVIQECGELPLALSLCGAMVRDGDASWELVWEHLKNSDLREIRKKLGHDYPYLNLQKTMEASIHMLKIEFIEQYEDRKLANELIELYYTLGIFKTGESIPENVIVNFWTSACSITTFRAKGLLNKLKNRYLLNITGEEPYRRIELHDLQHDFTKAMLETEEHQHRAFLRQYNPDEASWYEILDDGYIRDHLIFHLIKAGKQHDIPVLFSQEKWVRSRDLTKLLVDFQEAKNILTTDDLSNRIRYKLYDDVIRDRYSGLPVEIAKEMVIRNLISPNVFTSAVYGMSGSAKEKIDVYISAIRMGTTPIALKEFFALEAFAYVQKIDDADTQSSTILQLYDYLSTTEKRKKYRMLWNVVFDIQNNIRRNQVLKELLSKLSEEERYQLVNDFLEKDIPVLRSIYLIGVIQNFIQKDSFLIKKMWESVLNKVLNKYIKDEKAFMLASIAVRLPSQIGIDLSPYVWESLNECEYWENGGSYYDEDYFGEIFDPLMPYINIKDVSKLWERAKHEFEEETWGGQQALISVLKNWMFFNDKQGYLKEVQDDMVAYFKSLAPKELYYQRRMTWVEIRIKQLEANSDVETLFNGWFEIFKIALGLSPTMRKEREIYDVFLGNCSDSIPKELTLRIWISLIDDYAMKTAGQEDERGEHWKYNDLLISLVKQVPKEHALEAMQLAFKFKTTYPSLINNIFPNIVGQLLIQINDKNRQYWWNKAKKEIFNKYYGTPSFSVLLKILRELQETDWKNTQLDHLMDELVENFNNRYPVLVGDYFPYIPEESRSVELKKIINQIPDNADMDKFFITLLEEQPEFIGNLMEVVDDRERIYEALIKIVAKRSWGRHAIQNSDAFISFLQDISKKKKKFIWKLISSDILSKEYVAIETLIIFLEEMIDENRKKVLPTIVSRTYGENDAKEYSALAVKNWNGTTIWEVWEYMHKFDPDGEFWALALAPHIPTVYLAQAFEIALHHTYPTSWPWDETCTILAARLPNQFADSMWRSLEERIPRTDNISIRRDLRSIQIALIPSLSDKFLISTLQEGFNQNKAAKRIFTKTNFIGGNMIDYFRPLFLLSFPKNIRTLNKNGTLISRIIEQYRKVHKAHKKLASLGSIIFGSMIALTYPVAFPILRFLYKRKEDDSFYLPFFFESTVFIAKSIPSMFLGLLNMGVGRDFSRFFSRHVEFSEEKIVESRVVNYFYKEVTASNMPEWLMNMILRTVILLKMLSLRNVFLGVQFVISIPLGIILFFITFLIRLGLLIFFVDIFAVERFFEDALTAHLLISKSSIWKDLLQRWLNNEKVFDLLALRPLFDQAGGKKLRKTASSAYRDANTWWYDVIANPENIFGKDAF